MVNSKFNISDYVNPVVFIIAFSIGIFCVYIMKPKQHFIIKYPTPDNAGKIIYQDLSESCYKYKSEQVECPKDPNKISITKIQDTLLQNDINNINNSTNFFDNIKMLFSQNNQ